MSWLETLTEGTLWHACDGTRLAQEAIALTDIGTARQLRIGALTAARMFPLRIICGLGIQALVNSCFSFQKKIDPSKPSIPTVMHRMRCFKVNILKPIQEEIIFRGLFECAIYSAQVGLKTYALNKSYHLDTITWITSPSARVLTVAAIYAIAHLKNMTVLPARAVVAQTISHFIFPAESILRETTGLKAAIAAHATYNSMGYLITVLANQ